MYSYLHQDDTATSYLDSGSSSYLLFNNLEST
uniref:Uncharacterized protein n=1 Tax=Caudovirales sp. ctTqA28 TaxID=2826775 RepID=A0A8S5MDY3_9CAUD|nr:MAG TPA: hypothetical protein [Caudovirales sp. ctTqA28]